MAGQTAANRRAVRAEMRDRATFVIRTEHGSTVPFRFEGDTPGDGDGRLRARAWLASNGLDPAPFAGSLWERVIGA